ncbi:GntR family transcriptional regulator [Agrococcus sp. ProA11]|uniref:FadR/GntR family transcriptional regulator n=1 Tax=Agrococcus chionoecetis TaxID=3153752 RepID=UPI003260D0D9
MSTPPSAPPTRWGRPTRLLSAVFRPIGDEGRAALVERRIAEAIMGGVLQPGERLPSEAEMAQSFGVAPATARESLLALRARGLIVTRRGRGGGSFVADSADPAAFARSALLRTSRVGLRDAAVHYLAITRASVELAARRAAPSEVEQIAARLRRADRSDPTAWRRQCDDAQIELSALSQSARLTREQMRLQAELSPLLALVESDPAERDRMADGFLEVLDLAARGDAARASALVRDGIGRAVEWLIAYRAELEAG